MFVKAVQRNQALMRNFNMQRMAVRAFSSSSEEIANLSVSEQHELVHTTDPLNAAIEPKFLENVQQMVDNAAAKANIAPDMLKYIMACDNVIRF